MTTETAPPPSGPPPPQAHSCPGAAAIELRGLTKRYGRRLAVDRLDLALPRGVVAGFIGPNGAGKTTTMAMLLGLVRPTAGSGSVLGAPLSAGARYLRRVGALIETPAFYRSLTGRENLRVLAIAGGHPESRVDVVLDQAGLAGRGDDQFGSYSLGMKQRLGIAAALLGDPEILMLDEPTNGLDPAGMRDVREMLAAMAGEGRTMFVSSHVLAELEQVCDWLAVIDHGRLLYQGPTSELAGHAPTRIAAVPEHGDDIGRLRQALTARGFDVVAVGDGLLFESSPENARALGAAINRCAAVAGVVLAELSVTRPNLEQRYLSMLSGGTQ